MRIQYLNGGLANQVFQYIFVRYAELSNPGEEPWLLDDSFFFVNNIHNGYELEKVFGIKANLLSKNFDEEVWAEFIKNKKNGISIPQSFKNLGFNIFMIAEFGNYISHNPFDGTIYHVPGNTFIPDITRAECEIAYYHGYWLDDHWFNAYRDILLSEFTFPDIEDPLNTMYAYQILTTDSVAVHVRRGDYVTIGWASKNSFYLEATQEILKVHPDSVFFIFSDDIEWCKKNHSELGFDLPREVVYVEGNSGAQSYRDLQLMSLCKGMILSKSAFCYLALLLSPAKEYYMKDNSPR